MYINLKPLWQIIMLQVLTDCAFMSVPNALKTIAFLKKETGNECKKRHLKVCYGEEKREVYGIQPNDPLAKVGWGSSRKQDF